MRKTITVDTKFYLFNQNNSGGSWVIDKKRGIAHFVIIEALSESDANRRAEEIGIYFDGCEDGMDCNCCGDRWDRAYNGTEQPEIYGQTDFSKLDRYNETKSKAIHFIEGKIDWTDAKTE